MTASIFSAERLALLLDLWPSATPGVQIVARINALPGLLLTYKQVASRASKLGVGRPPEIIHAPRPHRGAALNKVMSRHYFDDGWFPVVSDEVPVLMDLTAVAAWAAKHGVPFRGWDDLPAVNARLTRMGKPRFAKPLPCHQRQMRRAA